MLLLLSVPRPHDFGSRMEWDAAHASTAAHGADWLLPYTSISTVLRPWLLAAPSGPILELGCGTSSLARELVADGFSEVTACDYSVVAIERAKSHHDGVAGLTFAVEDARRLSFGDSSFASVVDKGTLDAICTGEGYDYEAKLVGSEVARVLVPGGRWACLSLMPPSVVRPLLTNSQWWSTFDYRQIGGFHLYMAVAKW